MHILDESDLEDAVVAEDDANGNDEEELVAQLPRNEAEAERRRGFTTCRMMVDGYLHEGDIGCSL